MSPKTPNPIWFEKLLDAAEQMAGTPTQLSREIGLAHNTIAGWREGASPRMDHLVRLLNYTGGDITRALPGHAEESVPGETLTVAGRVSAGVVRLAVEDHEEIPGIAATWRDSAFRPLTHGPVVYLRVDGDSMEPHYPDGCLLACARPAGGDLRDLTPCIARVEDEATFKLARVRAREIELIPLNFPVHDIQRFPARRVDIDYIVLGYINPWLVGLPRPRTETPRLGPILFRDSGG